MDDNAAIMLHVADLLHDIGFSTCSVGDVESATRLLAQYGDNTALLFTNVELVNNMEGYEIARHAAQRWPDMGIIVASGHHRPACGETPDGSVFLVEPFMDCDFLASVREVMTAIQPDLVATGQLTL